MNRFFKRTFATVTALSIMVFGLVLSGCGGGSGGVSSSVVSGTAAVGVALSGQVNLKDSSSPAKIKSTIIGSVGTFAIDVTGMTAPYVLQANGTANGTTYKLHSFSDDKGTANINPLSDAIVASAAGVTVPSDAYDKADSDSNHKISSNLSKTVTAILTKLQPLLQHYSADNTNPITAHYIINHLGLDDMFDNIKVKIVNGTLSILNANSGAVIYTGSLSDIANGVFNNGAMPTPPAMPVAPAMLTAVGGTGQVTLSWNSVSNATTYNVYYSTASGVTTASGTKIAGATSPYIQTGLASGTTFYYVVTAVNSAGESAASSQASAATASAPPVPTVPAAPTGEIATGGTNQVTLSWTAVSTATSYNVYYSTTSGVTTANGTKISNATSPVVQTGLASGTTYYYIVTGANSAGEGAASVQVAATTLPAVPTPVAPAAPTGVTAVGGATQATISWPAVSGATSYNVYYSTTSGVTKTSGTKVSGVTSPYVKTGLSAGTAYYFIVTAANSVGESAASTQATATTSPAAPAVPVAPTGVTATGGANQVSVSWTAVSGATSYNIYWSTVTGVNTTSGTKISGAASPYVQTGLAAGTAYYYVVTAANASGESPASSQIAATTNAAAPVVPAAPAGVTAVGGTSQETITWSPVSGATSYNIYYATTSGVTKTSGSKITNATSPYVQTGLAAGTAYYYIVTAVNSAGESAASTQASATTAAPAINGAALYTQYCYGCHGNLGPRTSSDISTAIAGISSMSKFRSTGSVPLSAAQIDAIAASM